MSVDRFARILWDYHHLNHTLEPADCILVLGSHDVRVAERGAELFLAGWAPLLVLSGNLGWLTSTMWDRPEAEIFADVAAARGVPRDRMIVEARSTNTGENVDFTRDLLSGRGITVKKAITVQKPYMERRGHATFQQRWPELQVLATSPPIGFEDYPNEAISKEDVIHIMVGDFQRLILYAAKGWSAPQGIPPEVMEAYERLVDAGYTRRLVEAKDRWRR